MKKRFLFLIVLILAIGSVNAQGCEEFIGNECAELKWERAEAISGEIAEIAISPTNPDVMYAGIEVNSHSLYKSSDGGKTWKKINGGGDHTKDVAVSPKDPNKVYFAMSETVHTTDLSVNPTSRSFVSPAWPGSESIDILSSGRPPGPSETSFSTIEIFEQDAKIIYAAVKGGGFGPFGSQGPTIFKTTNGGNSWTRLEPDLEDANVIAIHPTNHEHIYVGSGDGVYESLDSGKTLKKIKSTRALGGFISIEFQFDNPSIIYIASGSEVFKTEDAGANWKDIKGQLSDIHRVRVSKSNQNILYASTFNGVFRSDDYGKTWIDKTSNLKAKNVQIITIHPENPDIAFVGHSSLWSSVRAELRYKQALWANNGIFKTTDGGNSWFRSDDGIFEYDIEEVAVSPHRANEAWVESPASRGGYKTIDAAHNWRLTQIQTLHYPMKIKYSMQDADKIYITSWHSGGPFGLSLDGGASWKLTNEDEFFKGMNRGSNLLNRGQRGHIHVHGLAVDPNDDSIVYSGSVREELRIGGDEFPLEGAHIFKSTDTGKTWQESDEGFPHEEHTAIHDIQIDPKNTNIIYVATTEHEASVGVGIYKSTNAGKTWNTINNGLDDLSVGAVAIHPENTQLLLAATHSGLYKSKDGGLLWYRTSESNSFDVEYVQNEPNTVYASTNDGVLKSGDFGDTWYKVGYGLPSGEGQGIGVGMDGNVIYTAVKGHGVYVARIKPVDPIEPVSVITNRGFEFAMGIGTREFDIPDKGISSRGFDEDRGLEGPPDSMLEEICKEHTWPPSCSYIPDKTGRDVCESCKAFGIKSGYEGREAIETITLEECKILKLIDDCNELEDSKDIVDCKECKKLLAKESSEKYEKPNFFKRIINFFNKLFGISKKSEQQEKIQTVDDELSDFIKETEDIMEKKKLEKDIAPQADTKKELDSFEIKEQCKKYPMPPDCSFIHEEERRLFCEKCKQIFTELGVAQQIKQSKDDRQNIIPGVPSCGDKKELFTVSHIPISKLQNIVPLGNLNPPGHTFPTNHLYFHLKGFSGDESSSNAPVVAPGDIWVTRIGSSEYTMKGRQIKDYKFDFTVCTDVRGYFIHLTSLSEKLLQSFAQPDNCEEYDTGGIHYKNCEKDFYSSPVSVAANEPIGTAGGSSDFGLADLRTQELVYANTKRWYEDPLHRVCPLDYFTKSVGIQLKSLLGSSDRKRTVEPVCGEVAQDKPETAQGVWFVKGTSETYPEDPHLALVHDNIDPAKAVFSVGTSIKGLSSGTYYFNPASSSLVNRDFKDIAADGKVYCYEAQGGRTYQYVAVILQLTSPTTLRIEKQNSNNCGNGPWTFSSNYADFER